MATRKQTPIVEPLRRYTAHLACELTDHQVQERGTQLAHTQQLAEQHAVEAKEVRSKLKDREDELSALLSGLARVVRERKEQRPVEVEVRPGRVPGMVEEVRLDTGDVIGTRRMTDDERQGDLLSVPELFSSGAVAAERS